MQHVRHYLVPSSPVSRMVVQRKSMCACGGGCPRCTQNTPHETIQTKLQVSKPGDQYEQEANRVAEQVMRMPLPAESSESAFTKQALFADVQSERHQKQPKRIQKKETARKAAPDHSGHLPSMIQGALNSSGQNLSPSARAFMEPRFGKDFSEVRVHTDARAAVAARSLGASAFTLGDDIVFGAGAFAPDSESGRALLAHELTHVIQQRQSTDHTQHLHAAPAIQRRLIATGDPLDIAEFIALFAPATGLVLNWDPATHEITATGSQAAPARSPAAAALLTTILNNQVQNAEINFGHAQAQVAIGAFPSPDDLTKGAVQKIDMDDVQAIEAVAPGHGVAAVAHEMDENYQAHSRIPVRGVGRFDPAHGHATETQSDIAVDFAGPGRRVASVVVFVNINVDRGVWDFENYYLLTDRTFNEVSGSWDVSHVRIASKDVVSVNTIDSFLTSSEAVPAAGGVQVAAVVADLKANDSSTVLIEGFTDNAGADVNNQNLGRRRAELTRNRVVVAAVTAGVGDAAARIHVVGVGATRFVAGNGTDAERARNRRVVITVTRPGL